MIYEKRLTEGKSDQFNRSHGIFIRIRGRVVNLEDELFGLDALNHAAWARFAITVDADGLRDHLLSSREGVRASEPVRMLRTYIHRMFNRCRNAYEEWQDKEKLGIDIESLLRDAPSLYVTEPILAGVRKTVENDEESFYISVPDIPADTEQEDWLAEFSEALAESPFKRVTFERTGRYDRALRFVPDTRTLIMNLEHPFVDKLTTGAKNRAPATLFGSSEVLMDVLLQEHGFRQAEILDLLEDRDRVLRLIAGDHPATAEEVLRLLGVANRSDRALERATGSAFRVLGFEYERRGGNDGGPDGVLYARLGRGDDSLADYKVVYDSKQTNQPSVPADKIDLDSLEVFRTAENADFGFFLAEAYAAQDDPNSKLNKKIGVATAGKNPQPVTLLRIKDLRKLVELHYRYGVTLTRLRPLFEQAHTVQEVEAWIDRLETELSELEPQVPLLRLLEGLEQAKTDQKAQPNVAAVRAVDNSLKEFSPERLIAALKAVETIVGKRWIEVETRGDVRLHHNASQIVAEVERHIGTMFGGAGPSENTDKK